MPESKKPSMKKKIILSALMSALLITSFALSACGGEPAAPADTSAEQPGASADKPEEAETEPLETTLIDALPSDLDFEGYEVRLVTPAILETKYQMHLMPLEENGEILNDTAYRRNREVEERYNVKLSMIGTDSDSISDTIKKSVMAGSDDYQFAHFMSAWENQISLIKDGALFNLLEIPEFDIDSPGYYSALNRDLIINDKLYFAFSQYGNAGTLPLYMIFNKNMVTDNGLDMPYGRVFDGTWTWDNFNGYLKNVYNDLNGNGKKDKEDRIAYANVATLTHYLVFGFDVSVVKRTENGRYESDILNEKFVNAAQKILEFKTYDEVYTPNDINTDDRHMFLYGNVMFTNSGTSTLDNYLREIEDFDFGILPYPKLNDAQEKYSNYFCPNQFAVPVTVSRPDIVAYVLEGLAVISREEMAPAYTDVYVQEKLLRDKESKQVCRLLMEDSIIDPSRYYDFAGGKITPVYLLGNVKNPDEVVSKFTSVEQKAQGKAEDFFSVFF